MSDSLAVGFRPREFEVRRHDEAMSLGDEGQFEWWGSELPPKEYWLINPFERQLEVPTDERNLVVPRLVLEVGRKSVSPEHVWATNITRDDHMYWPESAYKAAAHELDNLLPHIFRNIPPNKIRLPWGFERWKHRLMLPSDFPDLETMYMSVRAWRSAEGLFHSIMDATRLEKQRRTRAEGLRLGTCKSRPRNPEDGESEDYFVEALADKFRGVAIDLERHQKIPAAYRFIETDDSVKDVARKLSFLIKNGCRDGITSRQLNFPPAEGVTPAPAVKRDRRAA